MSSLTNLGKRRYEVLRDSAYDSVNGTTNLTSGWVDGEWIGSTSRTVTIFANIQPAMASYQSKMLPEGEREKEAINIFSNDWLYTARTGRNALEADVILYRGAKWRVVVVKPYGNFGQHCEAFAIKVDDTLVTRHEGTTGVVE